VTGRFVGRTTELALLRKRLERVASSGSGVAVTIRGRRQVGKSRLVQEFCDGAGVPYLYLTATKGAAPSESLSTVLRELRESSLPVAPELLPEVAPATWADTLRTLAAALPATPSVVVIDELPWLAEQDPVFDGALQVAWDRLLSGRPVLLLLLGSDVHMMERLTAYDRPFFGRADALVLGPLNPAEVGAALALPPAAAIDAQLICGGLPGILRSWPVGMPPMAFLEQECADPAAPVFGVAESALLGEFPSPDLARRALEAVGSGDRTQANIAATVANRSGALSSGTLSPLLRQLVEEKRVLAVDQPLSTRPGRPALYRVADPNLRLYLAALREAQELSRRGRPGAAFELVTRRWSSWRGRAVEPLIRESLELAAASGRLPWPGVTTVGGWWNRRFDPELDLVGADRGPIAGRIDFVGSVKWLGTPVDGRDVGAARHALPAVPGADTDRTGLVIASLSGRAPDVDPRAADVWWSPDDVVTAWS
jgi:hypothetical protein